MPGDATGGDPARIVVDESSFDFRNLTGEQLEDLLEDFSDQLAHLLLNHDVRTSPWWSETECSPGQALWRFLYERRASGVSPDARRRMALHMDRCGTWDDALDGIPDEVEVDGEAVMALSIGYALRNHLRGFSTSCLVFPGARRRGWVPVSCTDGDGKLLFFADADRLTEFWRALFQREQIPEREFFSLAEAAFPGLVFADSLTFRKFDGTYRELRDWVVHALTVLHDHFPAAFGSHAGQPKAVQAELARHGLDLSPESPKTRANPKVIRQRKVEHEGETYDCQWHAKKDPTRNRVHFTVPEPRLGGRMLIGIFVDHLDT